MPGSYDPVTLGHVDIIRRASVLFDQVIVTAMINAEKQYCFTAEERLSFLKDAVKDMPNVSVEYSEEMLYEYVTRKGGSSFPGRVLPVEIKPGKDTDYEIWMAEYNRAHAPGCDTLLLPADKDLTAVSSTEVKRLAKEGQDITSLVTPMVAAALKKS